MVGGADRLASILRPQSCNHLLDADVSLTTDPARVACGTRIEDGMLRLRTRWVGVAAAVMLSAGIAAAAPATLERNAKVRSGPGTSYAVVATLSRGSVLETNGCTGGWCEIAWRGGRGFVAHSLLALGGAPAAAAIVPRPIYDGNDYPGFDYPGYAPGYAYAPALGPAVPVAPRWYRDRRRWSGWHHRPYGAGWAGRPSQPPIGAAGARNPSAFGRARFAPAPAASAPAVAAPAVPAVAAPVGAAVRGER
jgi:uncharacterized protein YraI